MTQQEIQERNNQIAKMLGYSIASVQFNQSWHYLMEAVEFIKANTRLSVDSSNAKTNEYFIDEWEFKVKSYYIKLIQWTEEGWRMIDKDNTDLFIYYVIGENCSSEKEAVFLAVSDFAKLYNEGKL